MKIGVFDSGIGGTTILSALKSRIQNAEYFYIADSKNCPYGEKTDSELYQIVSNNVKTLQDWGAKIIIIACNTATTKCINKLRADYPKLVFIGTEPAIKLAADSNFQNILVLATPGTIHSERVQKLIQENQKPFQKITLLPCPGLADTIEKHLKSNPEKINSKLSELLKQDTSYDAVVLGCTHYPLIKDQIKKYYPTATIIDGGDGVARQTEKALKIISSQCS